MLQQGFRDQQGERVAGLREMLEKLRRRRKDELERYDLGGVYDDIAGETPALRPDVPPELSYSATWLLTHSLGLGSYSPERDMGPL